MKLRHRSGRRTSNTFERSKANVSRQGWRIADGLCKLSGGRGGETVPQHLAGAKRGRTVQVDPGGRDGSGRVHFSGPPRQDPDGFCRHAEMIGDSLAKHCGKCPTHRGPAYGNTYCTVEIDIHLCVSVVLRRRGDRDAVFHGCQCQPAEMGRRSLVKPQKLLAAAVVPRRFSQAVNEDGQRVVGDDLAKMCGESLLTAVTIPSANLERIKVKMTGDCFDNALDRRDRLRSSNIATRDVRG